MRLSSTRLHAIRAVWYGQSPARRRSGALAGLGHPPGPRQVDTMAAVTRATDRVLPPKIVRLIRQSG